ncbi:MULTISPECIES: 2Fe-2S iron-sulfur cluster-binding protein [unclassified Pseudomonas]|uniref:2Fe-2S iron-sulfur cluster-binding protein n=1 Tax=unclassified Pseudomonas TaxID=196821 RepID=UPI000BA307BB|nr:MULTISPECIES: 2Fe-2S iron-sulfur cluster-binding protein [unclassified Pseudomonas]MCU1724120.1 2Fe-2S iron-sulfur cluster-binding protein [Pseudomonas sp. 5P_5.1_Bac1]
MDDGFQVRLASGESFRVQPQESLLGAMERQGRHCIEVGCRGGGCGVCKIRVLEGEVHRGPTSTARVTPEEREQGYALACRTYPRSDLLIEQTADPVRRVAR